jgi:hypothetical protein
MATLVSIAKQRSFQLLAIPSSDLFALFVLCTSIIFLYIASGLVDTAALVPSDQTKQ